VNYQGGIVPNVYKPGLLQIRPQYTPDPDSGDTPENVTWWLSATTTTPSLGDLTAIAGVFDTHWGAIFAAYGAAAQNYTGSKVTDWSSATGLEQSTVGVFTPVAGTGGTGAPPQVAILQSFQINLRWRGGHFRTYYPYVGAANLGGFGNDTVAGGTVTAMETAYTNLVVAMAASGTLGGQVPRAYKDKNNATTATLYPIVSQLINPKVATQRRRVRHVGRK
jgi:hypothetical protein